MAETLGQIGGIVLCGGRSRRMGLDKAWLPFGEKSLLGGTACLVAGIVEPNNVIIVAAPNQDLPELTYDSVVIRDRWPGEGPLAGMATGLEAFDANVTWVLVCCCDLPLLSPNVLELLVATARGLEDNIECQAVIPRVEQMWQPLTAIYRRTLAPRLHDLLRQGKRRMTDLLDGIAVRELCEEELRQVDPELLSFRHCNTPDEYEALLKLSGR